MMDDLIRVRCLACGSRLELPPRSNYATCKKCGSEYLLSRRGGAYALQPLAPEELALTKEIAAVEYEGEMGCANLALSMVAGVVVLFCVVGGIGRFVFNSQAVCVGSGVLALGMVTVGAVVLLRNLDRDRLRRAALLARQEAIAPLEPPLPEDGASAAGGVAPVVDPSS